MLNRNIHQLFQASADKESYLDKLTSRKKKRQLTELGKGSSKSATEQSLAEHMRKWQNRISK